MKLYSKEWFKREIISVSLALILVSAVILFTLGVCKFIEWYLVG